MSTEESKVTTFSSILLILLREIRVERNIHQAQIADLFGKTPSAWTKVETGRSPLSFDAFFRLCNGMHISPTAVMAAMERYAALLSQNGWAVIATDLGFNEDLLLRHAQEYWASPGFRSRPPQVNWGFTSVLNGPVYNPNGTITLAAVFQFVLDPTFRQQQSNTQPEVHQHL